MKVLVTGGTGFIGSHTARAVLGAGHRLRLLVRDPKKAHRVLGPEAVAGAELVVGDVTDEGAVAKALANCDAVLHAAALVALERSQAGHVLATNARGAELVVGGAVARGIPSVVYVSSASALFTPGVACITPDLPVAPARSAYARSKADAERFVRRLQEEGGPVRVSYPCGVLGPDDPGMSEANHALFTFYRDFFVITSGAFQIVDVRDLAELHRRLLEHEGGPNSYIAAGENMPWRKLGERLDALTGAPMRCVSIPGPVMRAAGRVGDVVKRVVDFNFPLTLEAMDFATRWPGADASRTSTELGLRFRSADETLADTLRWMVRAGHLPAAKIGRLAA